MTTTGVVGLGIMGLAIARHLLDAGCEVLGYDVDDARVRQFESDGGTALSSARAAAERADVVVTSLPGSQAAPARG